MALTPTIWCGRKGRRLFAECLAAARSLIDIVWLREIKAHAIDTPERRAAFEERLERLLSEIGNARSRITSPRGEEPALFSLAQARGGGKQAANAASCPGMSGATLIPSSYGFATTITLALINHPGC